MSPHAVEWVSENEIRKIFNQGKYYEKVLSGEYESELKRDNLPSRLPNGEPPGTRSQIVVYSTHDGERVALVHQYLRPDGTLGASGKPDPKAIFLKNKIIKVRRN